MEKRVLFTGLLGAVACTNAIPETAEAKPKTQPNILIIYTDDMGIGDLSCYNNGWMRTPNIDAMAAEGIRFNQYYSSAPVSSPSRTGLTTGIFPLEMGINTFLQERKGNAKWQQNDFLDSSAPSMARALKEAGYATGHFGKWHMGGGRDVDNAPQIPAYGFDEYLSTWESPDPAPEITSTDWIWAASDSVKRWERTAYFVEKTLDFFARHKGQPCFVNLWPDDMHTPWVPSKRIQDEADGFSSQPNFEEVMVEYDRVMGILMAGLKKQGIDQNTIVIFTSDNGPAPSFEMIRSNGLRGQKLSLYEGGIRMPFIVRWPEGIKPGQVDQTTVLGAVDMFPTLCALAGANMPKGPVFRGEDMSKAFVGKPQKRTKDLMWEYGMGDKNAGPKEPGMRSPSLGIRRGDFKLLLYPDGTQVELYNIVKDPKETTNIAAQNPALVAQLQSAVLDWWNARPVTRK